MSLLDKAKPVLDQFDSKKDKLDTNDGLPAGTYDCVVNGAQFRAANSGYEFISLDLKVVTGDYQNQHEFMSVLLDPEHVTKQGKLFGESPFFARNVKLIQKFADLTHLTLSDNDWEDQVSLGQALGDSIGQQIILKIKKTTAKSGDVFTNYDFEGYSENDLPF
ncbi:MAG: DUF669 domain-containing protein [Aerococcus sp.]|nr:DUF669 domain-containing protein [Aerococcus sp.]